MISRGMTALTGDADTRDSWARFLLRRTLTLRAI